jgi:TM2 domain-containing membrane protein YozV
MKGHVLDFSVQTNSGEISGADGQRYTFSGAEWRSRGAPVRGMTVDFHVDATQARAVYVALADAAGSKSKVAAGLLAILIGFLGIHKFYLGYTGPGLVYLLVNTIGFAITWLLGFVPNYALTVVAIVEGIIYLTKSDEEFERTYVAGYRPWF